MIFVTIDVMCMIAPNLFSSTTYVCQFSLSQMRKASCTEAYLLLTEIPSGISDQAPSVHLP